MSDAAGRIALVGYLGEPHVGRILDWRVLERELSIRLPGVVVDSYAPLADHLAMPLDDGRPARPLAELDAHGAYAAVVVDPALAAQIPADAGPCIEWPQRAALGSLAPALFDARVLDQRASYLRIVGALADGEMGIGCNDAEPGTRPFPSETPLIDQVAAIRTADSVATDSVAVAEAAAAFGVRWRCRSETAGREEPAATLAALAAALARRIPGGPEPGEDLASALARAESDRDRMRALYDDALLRAGTAGIGRSPAGGGLEDAAVLQAELQRVYSSRSWRWLAPLRALNARRSRLRAR